MKAIRSIRRWLRQNVTLRRTARGFEFSVWVSDVHGLALYVDSPTREIDLRINYGETTR